MTHEPRALHRWYCEPDLGYRSRVGKPTTHNSVVCSSCAQTIVIGYPRYSPPVIEINAINYSFVLVTSRRFLNLRSLPVSNRFILYLPVVGSTRQTHNWFVLLRIQFGN